MMTRKEIVSEFWQILLLGGAGIIMTWAGLTCRDCFDDTRGFWIIASFTAFMWIFLWKGNEYLGHLISTRISWLQFPERRLFVGLILMFLYTFGIMYVLGGIYQLIFGVSLTYGALYSVIITLIISLFMHGRSFFIYWKESTIDAERLKRENIAAKYETLKNQVNPHFLFNSFNALSNLVYEDPDKAVMFIRQLSEVYRYVLDTREKEVVSISEEIKFLQAYNYLQQIRFGDKLRMEVMVHTVNGFIAPLALQMLIENAIKHNIVSEDDPLSIKVFEDGDYIIVENNLQRKMKVGEDSAGVGLENIRKRYEYLSNRHVEVLQTQQTFKVMLPILHSETGS